MRRLFAVVLSALLVFGFAPVAKADVAGLTPVLKARDSSSVPPLQPLPRPRLVLRCTAKRHAETMACLT